MRLPTVLLAILTIHVVSQGTAQQSLVLQDALPTHGPAAGPTGYRFPVAAQAPGTGSGRLREVGLLIGIFGVALASSAVDEPDPLECGPCDRSDIPFFDRWAVARVHREWDVVSTATLLGVAGVAWTGVFRRTDGSGFAHFGASVESLALTIAVTDMFKRAAARRRPYTFAEPLADLDGGNLRGAKSSWPSGHASIAFSLATSYWLSRGHEASPTLKRVTAAATVLTALLRVPAGRHFPSDVLAGAALGFGSALLVHTVRF